MSRLDQVQKRFIEEKLSNEQLRQLCLQQHEALKAANEMIEKAHPKFNWGKSALDAQAISLLNTSPPLVRAAIEKYTKVMGL